MESILEFHPVASIFPLLQGREFAELVNDIRENGLHESVILHPDGRIIDGRNRYRACVEAGVEPHFRTWEGGGSLISYVVSLNLHRRHLDESQRAMVGARIKPMFEEEARERQLSTLKHSIVPANLQERGESNTKAAEAVNVSPRSVASASKVLEQGTPELIEAVEKGEVAVSTAAVLAEAPKEEQKEIVAKGEREILKAAKEIRQQKAENKRIERIDKIVEISRGNVDLLDVVQKYPLIYADPPWKYEYIETESRAIENQYPTLTLEEICALPVREIAQEDCLLFLWATSPKLEESMQVIRAWGFDYRTCMVWVKDKIGMGYYARQKHELLLIAKRGNIPTPAPESRPESVVYGERTEHSVKPEAFYFIIEKMYPSLPKIELFSRQERKGWSSWGNQVCQQPSMISAIA